VNIAIVAPEAGDWQLQLAQQSGLGDVTFSGFAEQTAPTLTLGAPVANGGSWDLSWSIAGAPAGSDIQFFAATDDTAYDGAVISTGLSGSSGTFAWDGEGVATGSYYVYALLMGDDITPIDSYVSAAQLDVTGGHGLSVGLSGPTTVNSTAPFAIDIEVTNAGSTYAGGDEVYLDIPAGLAVFDAEGMTISGDGSLVMTLPSIATGASTDFLVTLAPDGTLANQMFSFSAALEGQGFDAQAVGDSDTLVLQESALCLLKGTRIAVEAGAVAVEHLKIGDCVLTPDGRLAPIRWIGQRTYNLNAFADGQLVAPVCVRRGALGTNIPDTDLYVSPGHGIWSGDAVVPAWRLINDVSIVRAEDIDLISYYNIELEEHELLLAHNAPVESFLDDGSFRKSFDNHADYWKLYPEAPLCRDIAPLQRIDAGFRLAAIRTKYNRIAGIAEARGPEGQLRGYVDVPGINGFVYGWAQDVDAPEEPVTLRIYIDNRYFTRVLANTYRQDLRDAGLGSGCHAFVSSIPPSCRGNVEVRRETDNTILPWTQTAQSDAA
jgi:hypothetical protein